MKLSVGWNYFLLGILTFVSRLPFLFAGYGSEDDSWGLVLNAQLMKSSGLYSFSRLPGHPVQEFALLIISDSGPFVMNLLSAFFSVIAVLSFFSISNQLNIKNACFWAACFSAVPVIYISGTYTIDYCWALAFILLSYRMLLARNMLLTGVFLGLAIGSRITSGAVIAGFAFILFADKDTSWNFKIRQFLLLGIFTGLTTLVCFLPAILRYGTAFVDVYRLPYPSLPKAFYKATFGVWGLTGFLGVLLLIVKRMRSRGYSEQVRAHSKGLLLTIGLYVAAFIALPQKAAFWIPAVPFVLILLADQELSTPWLRLIGVLFLLSPFVFGINVTDSDKGSDFSKLAIKKEISGQEVFIDPVTGPVLVEHFRRINRQKFILNCMPEYQSLRGKRLVLCGWWTNQFTVEAEKLGINPDVTIGEFYTREQLDSLRKIGFSLLYLKEIDRVNDERYRMNYTARVARPFLKVE